MTTINQNWSRNTADDVFAFDQLTIVGTTQSKNLFVNGYINDEIAFCQSVTNGRFEVTIKRVTHDRRIPFNPGDTLIIRVFSIDMYSPSERTAAAQEGEILFEGPIEPITEFRPTHEIRPELFNLFNLD